MVLMAIKQYFLFNSLALNSILNSKKLLGPSEAFCVGLMAIKQYFLFNSLALKSVLNSGKHLRLFVWA